MMIPDAQNRTSLRQRGSVLLPALIFLLILTLAATTTMRTSTLELRMAGNEQQRVETFELTQSIVDEVVGNPDNIRVSGNIGYVNCTPGVSGCNANDVAINNNLLPSAKAGNATVMVERLAPALSAPPRGINTSSDAFSAARFEVDTTYDGTAENEGKVGLVQGVLVLVPRGAQ
ncbi:MAG: pilus assembly PilX N-terminal domain-containing protein [Gammaproteobacteria bacterium]|nr:pilus assembly PilX N-terminal domain-containing protein [Pseudomonadales bacterium]MCP5345677.1 pilus assembly PilX N-terminal domain-containing protein [Pseudomonadales bacterium]